VLQTRLTTKENSIIDFSSFEFPADFSTKETYEKQCTGRLSAASRPTQSVMYVPLQVNRFDQSILLIVQYKYLKSSSGDFDSPESDPPHKIMRYWFDDDCFYYFQK